MKKIAIPIVLTVFALVAFTWAQTLSNGWTFTSATSAAGCTTTTSNGLCVVTTTPPALFAWLGSGTAVQIYPATAAAPVVSVFGRTGAVVSAAGDYQFSQLGGSLAASQLPATTTCDINGSFSTFTLNSSGTVTVAGPLTIAGCK
jgi:hypothetical protein